MLDVVLEYPIASRQLALLDRAGARAARRPHDDGAALPAGRTAASARSSTSATRAWCASIRAGIRRRCSFVALGFEHILDGIDHLLFIFCLVIPFRRLRPLVAIVTAFTVAHSITLIASAAGFAPDALWFPPLIEVLIALSIVYMALENIVGAKLERRWLIAFGFGLVHGFGFSFALRESLQFAGTHLATSLVVVQRRRRAGPAVRARAGRAGARLGCSSTSWPSGWGRSSCRRSSRTRRGTGCSIAAPSLRPYDSWLRS